MELYLAWLNRYERSEGEEKPIGLILCAGKTDETIEMLDLEKDGIRVSAYLLDGVAAQETAPAEAACSCGPCRGTDRATQRHRPREVMTFIRERLENWWMEAGNRMLNAL